MVGNIGWRADPFGLHQERYFNPNNVPTGLVRDDGNESFDVLPEPFRSHPQTLRSANSPDDLHAVIPDQTGLSPTSVGVSDSASTPEKYGFCTNCGTQAVAHSSFCAACGHSLLKGSTDVGFSAESQDALADSSSKSPDLPGVTWTIEAASGPLVLAHSENEYAVYDNQQTYGRWPMTDGCHRLASETYTALAHSVALPPPPQKGYPVQPLAQTPPSLTPLRWINIAALIGAAVGLLLTWGTAVDGIFSISVSGIDTDDGKLFGAVLIVAVLLTWWRVLRTNRLNGSLLIVAWLGLLAIGVVEIVHFSSLHAPQGVLALVGPGLYVDAAAAVVGVITAVLDFTHNWSSTSARNGRMSSI
jgi:hypothetical protein